MSDQYNSEPNKEASLPFSDYLRILGKGPKTRRSLTMEEAKAAFLQVLGNQVSDLQLGAFLLLMRANGESPDELRGFMSACREHFGLEDLRGNVDLDWSAYAGKWRYPPYYLLAIKLLVGKGYRILLHGDSGQFADRVYAEEAMALLGFEIAETLADAAEKLSQGQEVYLPLANFAAPLQRILHLKQELGVRSVFNTVVKLLNPLNAPCAIQGIFHKGVEQLHHAGTNFNATRRNLVFKGEGGEAEIRPDALNKLFISEDGILSESAFPAVIERQKRPSQWDLHALRALWNGGLQDSYGEACVITTTAAALVLMESLSLDEAKEKATALWQSREAL
ncbi:glycosyl transferase family protein [Thiomicrorhabdus sp.]|uniref:glycosyl transferase family protein n=1 Tax=Thiomicrorhabdus sp. TaxID=2039724 RepID=UPI0029C7B305|nr:glycosyl transferase family protein [Thiomicrorhabdus sp.]